MKLTFSQTQIYFLVVLFLAACLRLYQLGSNPPSLDWDEASLGYNAYSLLKTGNDEYGNSWPFSIRSFNDYKPPAYSYLAIPTIAIFGLNEFAVRLPSAVAGIVAVATIYFLTQGLISSKNKSSVIFHNFPLLSMFFLAISPWHLQFSRAAFEANIALTFYLLSITFFVRWLNQKKGSSSFNPSIIFSAIFAAGSLYAYHSARLVVPLFYFFSAIFYFKTVKFKFKQLIPPIIIGLILITPLFIVLSRGSATERFSTVSIFSNLGDDSREAERLTRQQEFQLQHQGFLRYFHSHKLTQAQIITRNYFEHFNLDFLFLRADGNPRHHASGMGLLYLAEFPLLLAGFYFLAKLPVKHVKIIWTILFVGPVASAMTASTPHAIRGMLMLPSLILATAYGAIQLFNQLNSSKMYRFIPGIYTFLFLINIFYYLNLYNVVTPVRFSQEWQYGYKQLVHKLQPLQSNYTDVLVTNKYDQPHIFFAFYNHIDPATYQTYAEEAPNHIDNIHFASIEGSDFLRTNTLIAAEPEKTPQDVDIIDQIKFLDGSVAFNLFETKY